MSIPNQSAESFPGAEQASGSEGAHSDIEKAFGLTDALPCEPVIADAEGLDTHYQKMQAYGKELLGVTERLDSMDAEFLQTVLDRVNEANQASFELTAFFSALDAGDFYPNLKVFLEELTTLRAEHREQRRLIVHTFQEQPRASEVMSDTQAQLPVYQQQAEKAEAAKKAAKQAVDDEEAAKKAAWLQMIEENRPGGEPQNSEEMQFLDDWNKYGVKAFGEPEPISDDTLAQFEAAEQRYRAKMQELEDAKLRAQTSLNYFLEINQLFVRSRERNEEIIGQNPDLEERCEALAVDLNEQAVHMNELVEKSRAAYVAVRTVSFPEFLPVEAGSGPNGEPLPVPLPASFEEWEHRMGTSQKAVDLSKRGAPAHASVESEVSSQPAESAESVESASPVAHGRIGEWISEEEDLGEDGAEETQDRAGADLTQIAS